LPTTPNYAAPSGVRTFEASVLRGLPTTPNYAAPRKEKRMRIRVTVELDVEAAGGFDLEGNKTQVEQAVEEAITNVLRNACGNGLNHFLEDDISIIPDVSVHVFEELNRPWY
jgi:hypothetical protein